MIKELKPCPFCGGEADFERIGSSRQSTIVACTDCGLEQESSDVGSMAGSSWNTRKLEGKLQREVEDLQRDAMGFHSIILQPLSSNNDTMYMSGRNDVIRLFEDLYLQGSKKQLEEFALQTRIEEAMLCREDFYQKKDYLAYGFQLNGSDCEKVSAWFDGRIEKLREEASKC